MENCTVLKSSDKIKQSSPDNIKKMWKITIKEAFI